MTNKFSHIKSHKKISATALSPTVSQSETKGIRGKPDKKRIGRDAYDTLMSFLAEDLETPTTAYGVLVANSTKRNLRKQIEEIFIP